MVGLPSGPVVVKFLSRFEVQSSDFKSRANSRLRVIKTVPSLAVRRKSVHANAECISIETRIATANIPICFICLSPYIQSYYDNIIDAKYGRAEYELHLFHQQYVLNLSQVQKHAQKQFHNSMNKDHRFFLTESNQYFQRSCLSSVIHAIIFFDHGKST